MARRKRILEDTDSDSSDGSEAGDFENDPDAREERALFEDPYQRKRRRKNGKDDALYGIFGEDSEEDGPGAGKKVSGGRQKRSDWTKAPAFVSGEKVDLDKEMDVDGNEEDGDDGEDDESEGDDDDKQEYSDDSEPSRPPSPRIREEEQDEPTEKPRMGGIGSRATTLNSADAFSDVDVGSSLPETSLRSSKGGLGFSRGLPTESPSGFSKGGIGSSRPTPSTSNVPLTESLPSTFGNQRSFVRDGKGSMSSPKPAAPLSATELAHFSKLQGSFGARILSKMGWQAGTGLGTTGDGIVIPVESKLRPQKMGIAFKGFKEKTEQSKMEARRRGELSDDEDGTTKKKGRRKEREEKEKRSDVWKRPKKVKAKVEHKTYEQIVAEAGQEAPISGIGQIIDATGAVVSILSYLSWSISDVSNYSREKCRRWLIYH